MRTFSEKDIYFKAAIVKYFEDKDPLFYKIENGEKLIIKDYINASFYKTSKYVSQKEYRILTHKLKENKIEGLYDKFHELENIEQLAISFFTEKQSGKSVENRPVFQEALNVLRMVERFVVEFIDC